MTNGNLVFGPATDLKSRQGGNWDRREFVKSLGALAGSAGLLGYDIKPAAAEPPPTMAIAPAPRPPASACHDPSVRRRS
jgi:hypothetical protein